MKLDFQFELEVTVLFDRVQKLGLARTFADDNSIGQLELRVVASWLPAIEAFAVEQRGPIIGKGALQESEIATSTMVETYRRVIVQSARPSESESIGSPGAKHWELRIRDVVPWSAMHGPRHRR